MRPFELTEQREEPGMLELSIAGELDLVVADRLRERLDRVTEDDVLICLEACDFIDSTGIAVVLQAQRRLAELGRSVVLFGASAQVLRVLSISGLTGDGFVVDTAAAARAVVERRRP